MGKFVGAASGVPGPALKCGCVATPRTELSQNFEAVSAAAKQRSRPSLLRESLLQSASYPKRLASHLYEPHKGQSEAGFRSRPEPKPFGRVSPPPTQLRARISSLYLLNVPSSIQHTPVLAAYTRTMSSSSEPKKTAVPKLPINELRPQSSESTAPLLELESVNIVETQILLDKELRPFAVRNTFGGIAFGCILPISKPKRFQLTPFPSISIQAYVIRVKMTNGTSFEVFRRYSQFVTLDETVRPLSGPGWHQTGPKHSRFCFIQAELQLFASTCVTICE